MMRLLVFDVLDDLVQLRNANAEGAIFYLPFKQSVLWKSIMDPFRRAALDELQRLGNRESRRQSQENVYMVGMPPISIAVI